MKRFTLRKIHQYAYSRQGWRMADKGFVYAIYDREWKKNIYEAHAWCNDDEYGDWKYIDNAHSKEIAQYWADWLNANMAETFGKKLHIPGNVFTAGLELYKSANAV